MVSSLLGLVAGLCLLVFSEAAPLLNCQNNRKYVEGFDDLYLSSYVNSTSTVRWTVVNENGATLHLGNCYGPYNCMTPYSSSVLNVVHYSQYTQVRLNNIASQFSGLVTCQETLTNGTVLSDTCQVNLARVSFRTTGHFHVRENGTSNIYCYNSPYTPSTVTWSLTTISGQTLDLGTCTEINTCTSPHAPDFIVRRPYNYRSQVYIRRMDRSKVGELFCSFTYKGLRETANVTLNVYSPATVSNCHAEVHPGNWSTILSCDVSNVFSSAGLYNFTVYESVQVLRRGKLIGAATYLFDGHLSYRHMLTPYTNITNNKVYYRGRLLYSWPLLPTPGIYTRLTVYFYYGVSVYTADYIGYTVNITTPSQPTNNCSELNYIPETGVVPCVCTADYLGSPAGRLVWLLGNVTIATGGYGVTQLTFPSGKVSSQHDGMMVTCQLDWVQPISTPFTRHVAYGPDSVKLQVMQSRDVSNNTLFRVISHVTEMKPMKADMVQWGGECQGQQGFTCTLTPRSASEVDGKTVTCRVTNTANNGHSAEASVVLTISSFSQSQTEKDQFNWTAVGVGVALGIVVIALVVLVVVMIVLCRRGRLCKSPKPSAPSSQEDDDSHIYTDLKLSKVTKKKRNAAQQGVTCPSAVYQGDGDTVYYENIATGGQGGHM